METRDYCAELYEKMQAEQAEYLKELLAQGSQEALNHAYHAAIKKMKNFLENTPQFSPAYSEQVKGFVSDSDGNALQTTK